jgi:hypothetical protein
VSHQRLATSVIFLIGSQIYAQAGLSYDPPIYISCVARMTGACHHAQLSLVKVGSHELFAQASLELQSSLSSPSTSQVARIRGVDHLT